MGQKVTRMMSHLCLTSLSMIMLIGPLFLTPSYALTISPFRVKANCIARRGIAFSLPTSSSANEGSSVRSFHHRFYGKRQSLKSSSVTNLYMYNLPPGGGGGGGKGGIAEIAKGVISIILLVAFFASPLGGLVLGIFNSFLVFLFVFPLLATVGFQVYQKLNTVQGPCPSCGVTVVVPKNKSRFSDVGSVPSAQSLCFSCGAILQANEGNTGINNVSGRKTIDDLNEPMGTGSSFFDFFSGSTPTQPWTTTTTTTATKSSTPSDKKDSQGLDKSNVIDVDVLDEDKPFQ